MRPRFTIAGLLLWVTFVGLVLSIVVPAEHAAAGLHGDTFIAAESHAVDLWDAAELRPRRRVFEPAPPNYWLPGWGLVIWLIAILSRRSMRASTSFRRRLLLAPAVHASAAS